MIAAVKRSSPSKGALATITDPAARSRLEYEKGGAVVIAGAAPRRAGLNMARWRISTPCRARVDIPVGAQGLRRDAAPGLGGLACPVPTSCSSSWLPSSRPCSSLAGRSVVHSLGA